MRYKFSELEKAIGIILPEYAKLRKSGVEANTPSWLKICAEQYFIEQFKEPDHRDISRMEAYGAIHSAISDLRDRGWMEEGTCELQFNFEKGEN